MKDYQQAKLYRAEDAAGVLVRTDDMTPGECRAYVRTVLRSPWLRRLYIQLSFERGRRAFDVPIGNVLTASRVSQIVEGMSFTEHNVSAWAYPYKGTTRIPPWGRNKSVILHELCHHITYAIAEWRRNIEKRTGSYYGLSDPGHGRQFAWLYWKMVRHFLGVQAGKALMAQYRTHKVRYTTRRAEGQGGGGRKAACPPPRRVV